MFKTLPPDWRWTRKNIFFNSSEVSLSDSLQNIVIDAGRKCFLGWKRNCLNKFIKQNVMKMIEKPCFKTFSPTFLVPPCSPEFCECLRAHLCPLLSDQLRVTLHAHWYYNLWIANFQRAILIKVMSHNVEIFTLLLSSWIN